MTAKKVSVDFVQAVGAFSGPTECVRDIVSAWADYAKIAQEEQTKRRGIESWEKTRLAEIQAKRDFLIGYLERSFDERSENFRSLFQVVDQAVASKDNQALALALNSITDLAKSSPFKDLANLASVKAALDNPDHVWEI